jgi:hypothetical protein
MQQTIFGIFTDRSDVETTIARLKEKGFNPEDVSIVMKNKEEQRDLGEDTGTNVAGGALSGAATGAVVGGIAGLLAGTVLPGLGGLLIGGPIGAVLGLTGAAATTVSGAATGAVAGGLIGALMGLGLKKDEAEHYQQRVEEGAILVAVPATSQNASYVESIFDECHAQDVKTIESTNQSEYQATSTKRHHADTMEESESEKSHSHNYQHAYQQAHPSGTKGGRADNAKGRGWHGDSKHHAAARKGKETHRSKK